MKTHSQYLIWGFVCMADHGGQNAFLKYMNIKMQIELKGSKTFVNEASYNDL